MEEPICTSRSRLPLNSSNMYWFNSKPSTLASKSSLISDAISKRFRTFLPRSNNKAFSARFSSTSSHRLILAGMTWLSLVITGNPNVKLLFPVATVSSSPIQKTRLNLVLVALYISVLGPSPIMDFRNSPKVRVGFRSSEYTSVISPFFLMTTTSSAPACTCRLKPLWSSLPICPSTVYFPCLLQSRPVGVSSVISGSLGTLPIDAAARAKCVSG